MGGGEEGSGGAKEVEDGETEGVGAGAEGEGEGGGAGVGEFWGGVDLEGGGEEVEEEGGGEEEEGEEKQEASGGVGFVVGIWIWGRRRIERDHARVQLGTVGWNVGGRRRGGSGLRAFWEIHGMGSWVRGWLHEKNDEMLKWVAL